MSIVVKASFISEILELDKTQLKTVIALMLRLLSQKEEIAMTSSSQLEADKPTD